MRVFICCDSDITQEQYDKFYVPDIKDLLKKHAELMRSPTFYIADTDTYSRDYISELGFDIETYGEDHVDKVMACNVMVLFLRNDIRSLTSTCIRDFISKLGYSTDKAELFMEHVKSKEWASVEECLEETNIISSNCKNDIHKILVI